ncbi:hypothetical protein BASA81_005109 [Batrachochytrium salamandrivorans]|nr:hypothetical protein BASA81_005109 [Batrachochytrium salamandrivorans]
MPSVSVDLSKVEPTWSSQSIAPSLDAMLSNAVSHQEPWLPQNFLKFLKEELNEENLLFWEEVEALKATANNKPLPPAELLTLPSAARLELNTNLQELFAMFVVDESPKQVNISHEQRDEILASQIHGFASSLITLESAQLEVKNLLEYGSWTRFYRKQMTQNMSPEERRTRSYLAVTGGVVTVAAYVPMMVLFVPRWYLFLLIVPVGVGMTGVITWWYKLCPILAFNGVFQRNGFRQVEIACPYVLQSNRRVAQHVNLVIIICSAVVVLVLFALTYAVEAGKGEVLYN